MATSDAKGRKIAITVSNASGIVLSVYDFALDSGLWGEKPKLGDTIYSGDERYYLNLSSQMFTSLGGNVNLSAANGGMVVVRWSWPPNEGATKSAYTEGTSGISIESRWTGQGSTFLTLQVSIGRLGLLVPTAEAR